MQHTIVDESFDASRVGWLRVLGVREVAGRGCAGSDALSRDDEPRATVAGRAVWVRTGNAGLSTGSVVAGEEGVAMKVEAGLIWR